MEHLAGQAGYVKGGRELHVRNPKDTRLLLRTLTCGFDVWRLQRTVCVAGAMLVECDDLVASFPGRCMNFMFFSVMRLYLVLWPIAGYGVRDLREGCWFPVAKIDEVQPSGVARFARCAEPSDGVLSLESLKGGSGVGMIQLDTLFLLFSICLFTDVGLLLSKKPAALSSLLDCATGCCVSLVWSLTSPLLDSVR